MQDLAPLFQIVIVIAAVVSPILLITRILRGNGPLTFAQLVYAPDAPAWPRGVQEEEPSPLRVRRVRGLAGGPARRFGRAAIGGHPDRRGLLQRLVRRAPCRG